MPGGLVVVSVAWLWEGVAEAVLCGRSTTWIPDLHLLHLPITLLALGTSLLGLGRGWPKRG